LFQNPPPSDEEEPKESWTSDSTRHSSRQINLRTKANITLRSQKARIASSLFDPKE